MADEGGRNVLGSTTVTAGAASESGFAAVLGVDLDRAFRAAAAMLGNQADAQDAIQASLERAWANWYRIREPAAGRAWFWRILVNECRRQLREKRRRPVRELDDALELPDDDPFRRALQSDVVGRAITILTDEQRAAVALRFWADLTVPEIAARLRIPEGTVKSRLHAAIEAMRLEVRRDPEAEP